MYYNIMLVLFSSNAVYQSFLGFQPGKPSLKWRLFRGSGFYSLKEHELAVQEAKTVPITAEMLGSS